MLQPLLAVLVFFNSTAAENFEFNKILHQLLSSLKYCQNWALIRERTYVSSWNISQHFLTASDITRFLHLMDIAVNPEKLNFTSFKKSLYLASSRMISLEKISDVHAEIKSLTIEIPIIIHKKAYLLTINFLTVEVFSLPCWKFKRQVYGLSDCIKQIIDEILSPVIETVEFNTNQSSLVKGVTCAVIQAYADFLRKRNIRSHGIRLINADIHELATWLKRMNLFENKSDEIEIIKLIENVHRLLNTIASNNIYARRLVQSRNSVCPLLVSNESINV